MDVDGMADGTVDADGSGVGAGWPRAVGETVSADGATVGAGVRGCVYGIDVPGMGQGSSIDALRNVFFNNEGSPYLRKKSPEIVLSHPSAGSSVGLHRGRGTTTSHLATSRSV